MRIVINHLTRMSPDLICAAGIDLNTGRHVRPLQNRRLRYRDTASNGGSYDIGAILEFERTRPRHHPPEVEDHEYMLHNLVPQGRLSAEEFWTVLSASAKERLQDIFGSELRRIGDSCATERGTGIASLGCVWPSQIIGFSVRRFREAFGDRDSIRIELLIGRHRFVFPVNDLRLYRLDDQLVNWVVNQPMLNSVSSRIQRNVPVILSVGLSRPWQRSLDDAPRHWLQVNNVHLADDPLWSVVPKTDHP